MTKISFRFCLVVLFLLFLFTNKGKQVHDATSSTFSLPIHTAVFIQGNHSIWKNHQQSSTYQIPKMLVTEDSLCDSDDDDDEEENKFPTFKKHTNLACKSNNNLYTLIAKYSDNIAKAKYKNSLLTKPNLEPIHIFYCVFRI